MKMSSLVMAYSAAPGTSDGSAGLPPPPPQHMTRQTNDYMIIDRLVGEAGDFQTGAQSRLTWASWVSCLCTAFPTFPPRQ